MVYRIVRGISKDYTTPDWSLGLYFRFSFIENQFFGEVCVLSSSEEPTKQKLVSLPVVHASIQSLALVGPRRGLQAGHRNGFLTSDYATACIVRA